MPGRARAHTQTEQAHARVCIYMYVYSEIHILEATRSLGQRMHTRSLSGLLGVTGELSGQTPRRIHKA